MLIKETCHLWVARFLYVLFYEKLFSLTDYDAFKGTIFFYEKNGKRVSQFHMSTGENLLLSILNSLNIRIKDRTRIHIRLL